MAFRPPTLPPFVRKNEAAARRPKTKAETAKPCSPTQLLGHPPCALQVAGSAGDFAFRQQL